MKISKIRIEQFRRFRQPVEIDGLHDGINLFVGPNEAGKSTVAEAIRVAFFERHRSGSVDVLRPWGDGAASPAVAIDFDLGGKAASLRKQFLQRRHCELVIDGQRSEGMQAEDCLAELLGFGFAGKGLSSPSHWGIPGLLWIEQGKAQELAEPVAHAGEYLQRALGAALGGVASSMGDAVIERIERERNALLSESQGKPRGDYGKAVDRLREITAELARVEAEVASYRERVDQLEKLRSEHARDEAGKPWVALREQERHARDRLADVARLRQARDEVQQDIKRIDEQRALYRERLALFDAQREQLASRRKAVEEARLALQAFGAALASCRPAHERARAAIDQARGTLALARQEEARRVLAGRAQELVRQAQKARDVLAQAEVEQQALAAAQREAASTELSEGDLANLREQRVRQRALEAVQEAVATRLRYRLDPDRSVRIGDREYSGDGEISIVAPTALALPGIGHIELIPGGDELAAAVRELQDVKARHQAALLGLGVASLDQAEARHLRHRELLGDVKRHRGALNLLAPAGVDALRSELDATGSRLRACQASLDELAPVPDGAADLPSVADAQAEEEAARIELERVSGVLSSAEAAASSARTSFETAQGELRASEAVVAAPDRAARLQQVQDRLTDAGAALDALNRRIVELQAGIDAVQPDLLEQDLRRCSASADALELAHRERESRINRLEAELQALGAQGLDEKRADLARDHEHTGRRVRELQRHAAALDHLLQTLRGKRAALTRRLHAPLQRHLNRYVQLLFPQATLELGEDFVPRLLTRPGREAGDFDELSFGAREQMGVISRLAYADLLKESGRPTLIILDDILVHSDEDRLTQMKRVLFDAASRHQIMLFSCHPEKWRDLGVRARAVDEFERGN